MTIQSCFKTAATVSLKTLRVLWGFVGALAAVIAYVLAESFKHAPKEDLKSGADLLDEQAASYYEPTSVWNYETEERGH